MLQRDIIFEQTLKCLWPHCHPECCDRTPMDVFNCHPTFKSGH